MYNAFWRDLQIYVQVAETLRGMDDTDTKLFERELRSLKKIDDNYKKLIVTGDKIPLANEEGNYHLEMYWIGY